MKVKYELSPSNGRKSFYGKAYVIEEDGKRILYSYDTPIIEKLANGNYVRLYDGIANGKQIGFTATTMTHVNSFCGLNKAKFLKLPLGKETQI